MAYLKRFPVDVIKIDRSFVSGLPGDEKDAALIEMFLQLTRRFGFTSLAEGIELDGQADWLKAHGCALGQGFLVSHSLPRDTFAKLLVAAQTAEALAN
jgi:EAL domain-containing protein (putative c-di-GMP-specific phosphodiesterase class I)